jgi:hypothetical protein
MLARSILRLTLLASALLLLSPALSLADPLADVATLLREIRQDQPVPALPYLHRTSPLNPDSESFKGRYGAVDISVETYPNSDRVAAILLEIPGPDRTRQLLPVVAAALGQPRSSDPAHGIYGWEWPGFRAASLHYAAGHGATQGRTVVSLFYR